MGLSASAQRQAWGALTPRLVDNTRADKLDSFMWRYSFLKRRCLIPATEFAEAEGEKGAKTRMWFAVPDEPVFAVAGIWRDTEEWGPALNGHDGGMYSRRHHA